MEDFEPTIEQINNEIKPAWQDIKTQSEELVNKLGCPRAFIGGMLNAIASDFAENSYLDKKLIEKDKLD